MKKTKLEREFEGRDRKRDRDGWQAKRKAARQAKSKRRAFEGGKKKGWH